MSKTKEEAKLAALRKWAEEPDRAWDYEGNDDDGPDDVFRSLIHVVERVPEGTYFACGSVALEHTPKALYRLLFLCQPKSVDFSDMYKTGLFVFTSRDARFLVSVELFKYEIGLYFGCVRDHLGGQGTGIIAGAPGADNGWRTSDEGAAFFGLVTAMAKRVLDVYSGNDFKV